jgi:hypothetical protein
MLMRSVFEPGLDFMALLTQTKPLILSEQVPAVILIQLSQSKSKEKQNLAADALSRSLTASQFGVSILGRDDNSYLDKALGIPHSGPCSTFHTVKLEQE